MVSKQKINKKSKTTRVKGLGKIKLALLLVIATLFIIGVIITGRQYLVYRSLDDKIDQVAEQLKQNGVDNIVKKDECNFDNKFGPIKCSVSISSKFQYIDIQSLYMHLNKVVEIMDSQKSLSMDSKLAGHPGLKNKNPYASTTISGNSLCTSTINTMSINSDNPDVLTIDLVCSYKAWWKQIL